MDPTVSIITPWLDHPEFIADYERAVHAPGVEVIIVDNGSAAANARLLADTVQRLGGKYIRNDQNRWFAAANNQGLAIATGDVIVFLNNDIAADPTWLDAVRRDVQPGGLYGPGLGDISIDGRKLTYIAGWCVAARREEFDRLDGWDSAAYEMPYWEDADLSLRAARAGVRLIQVPWPLVHKKNGTAGSVPGLRFAFKRNEEIFISRVHGGSRPTDCACTEPNEFIRAGRVAEAERIYADAVEREPNRPDLWTKYAQILEASGRFEAAEQALRRAMSLDPGHSDAYDSMGMLYLRTNRPAEAASQFRTLTQLNPASPRPPKRRHAWASRFRRRATIWEPSKCAGARFKSIRPACPPDCVSAMRCGRAETRGRRWRWRKTRAGFTPQFRMFTALRGWHFETWAASTRRARRWRTRWR